jgi:hypothetical protein
MSKHKSEDYKLTAVKFYLENDTNYTKTCEIFKCLERSLKRWIVHSLITFYQKVSKPSMKDMMKWCKL